MRSLRTLLAAATVMVAAGAANAATLTLTQDQVASFAAYDTLTTYNVTSNPAATPLPTVTFFANTPVETTQQLFGAAYWRARVGLSGLADLTPYTQLALSHYGISDPYSGTFSTTQIVLRDDQANEIITTAALLNIGAAGFNWSAVTFLGIDILQLYGYTGAIAGAGVRILSGDSYVTSADLFFESAVVPLPAGIMLLGSGIALMVAMGRRRAAEKIPVGVRTGLRKRSLWSSRSWGRSRQTPCLDNVIDDVRFRLIAGKYRYPRNPPRQRGCCGRGRGQDMTAVSQPPDRNFAIGA